MTASAYYDPPDHDDGRCAKCCENALTGDSDGFCAYHRQKADEDALDAEYERQANAQEAADFDRPTIEGSHSLWLKLQGMREAMEAVR